MDIPICQICGTSESLLRCAKCKTIYYCSRDHQHLDWPSHKNNCKHLSKQKKELQHQRLINSVNNVNIKSNNSNNSCVWPKSINDNSCSVHVHNDPTSMSSNSSVPNVNQMSMEIAMGLLNNTENELVNNPHSNNDAKQILNHFTNGILNEHNNDNCNTFQFAHRTESCILQMTNKMEPCEELSRIIINDLNTYGLSVVDDFLGRARGLQILNEVHQMYAAGEFQDGQLVSNLIADRDLRTIRGDKITWVMGQEEGCSNIGHLVKEIDAVVIRANKMKDNGKLGDYRIRERTKAMVACYPGSGSHYVKHVDNPNQDGRVITAIYYLNVDWDTKRSGGVLRIFPEGGGESVADVEPKFDRLIFFWSDRRNPHEVQPAHRTRYAITVWYFDSKEREIALKRSKAFRTIANTNGT